MLKYSLGLVTDGNGKPLPDEAFVTVTNTANDDETYINVEGPDAQRIAEQIAALSPKL